MEYRSWQHAKRRCYNKHEAFFKHYGGRGIAMCADWRDSFESFLRDMGPCPPGMSIDRIDTDGDYEPGNCRWASRRTQLNNKTNTRWIDFRGERLSIAEWGRRFAVGEANIRSRLAAGWPLEPALTMPVGQPRHTVSRLLASQERRVPS